MFNLGVAELAILLIGGVVMVGIPVGVVLLVMFLVRHQGGSRIAELEAESQRLREQLDDQHDPTVRGTPTPE